MAISYVGGVQGGRAGSTGTTTQSISGTLTGGSNTSPSQGDLILVWLSVGADTTAATGQTITGNTSGAYSNDALQSQLGTTYDAYSRLNWQFAGATPDTTLTIPSSGSARNAQRWAVHVFRGVDPTTPWDTASTTASGTASGRPNPPSITPATAGAWILWLGSSAAATGAAYTAPTDFSADWLGGTTADTADCMQGAGYYTGWASGAYDPAAISAGGTTGAADSWVAKTAVLRPAPSAYTLTAQHGSYTYTGQSATLLKTKVIVASQGSYTYTGQTATLLRSRLVTAQNGAYTYTGQTATLLRSKRIEANHGSYAYSGQDAILLRSKAIVAQHGSYALSGQSADITYTPAVTGYTLTAQHGTYALNGQDATLTKGLVLTAQHGSYALSGQDATLLKTKVVVAQTGSYAIAGQSATISYSGAPPAAQDGEYILRRRRRRM